MGYAFNPFTGNLDLTGSGASGDITGVSAGTGLTGGGASGDVTLSLADTAVSAGSYTYASITVDAQGRITSASSGTSPVTSVTGTAPISSSGGATPAISISAATSKADGSMSAADKAKLDGIASGATAFDPASPGAIGGTTASSSTFTRVTLPSQGSTPSTPATGFTFYANSSNALSWVGANGYIRTFDGTSNKANRTYTLPDSTGTVALVPGSDTHIAFNDGGSVLGGVSDLTYNKTTKLLTNKGDINLDDGGSYTTTLQTITPTANRTISFPDATGTLALVAGSSGQVVYNSSGANAGDSGLTYNATNKAITLGGATVTTSNPVLDLSQTWNAGAVAFTGLRFNVTNTASAAGSLLADFQLGGTSQLGIGREGHLVPVGNALEVRNSTTAQSFKVYNTYTSSTSFERLRLDWSSNVLILGPERGSAGGSVRELSIRGADGVGSNQAGGQVTIRGGVSTGSGAGGAIVFETTSAGSSGSSANTSTERLRIGTSGTISRNQAAPVAVNASATVTVADLQVGILTTDASPSTPVTATLPTGTNMDGGFINPYVNQAFEWSVINLDGTETVTVAGNTNHTIVGTATVAANVSARFASRRTAANTWVSYRLS